jgi:RHS repeat-associated protein
MGRVVSNGIMPKTGTTQQHLLLTFADHLGSTTFTIDHATSELVEYTTYTAYGQTESDYRTSRWDNHREHKRFTGKEEDIEVGLNYHGARYYSPAMKRWMSADPVTVHSAGSDINPWSYGYGNPTSFVDPDGRNPLIIAAVVGAVISAAVFTYHNGFNPESGSWWAGLGVAAGSGAVGGLTGGAVGLGLSAAMGAGAGTFAGSVFIGAISGIAGAGASYGTSWAGLTLAKGVGFNVSTEGYSLTGMAGSMAVGGLVGGAVGGAVWGGVKLYNALNNGTGNAAAAGQQAGKAADDAYTMTGATPEEAAKPPTTTQTKVLDTPPPPKVPEPKVIPKSAPNVAIAPGPKTVPPVEEQPPVYDPSKTAETDQWQAKQAPPGWNKEHSASWSSTKRYVPEKAVATLSEIDRTAAAPPGYRGGGPFSNDGRGGGQVLPQATPNGTPITYQEWDVNPYTRGVNRGAERLVTGSDGSAWFTNDHYQHFNRMR